MKKYILTVWILLIACTLFPHSAFAAPAEAFKTPDQAVDALIASVRSGDRDGMLKILGDSDDSKAILSSGDQVADKQTRDMFLDAYDKKHHVDMKEEKVAILSVGDEDWPFPIPVMHAAEGWMFDTAVGRKTILYRRIGRNELNTIQVCKAYVDAQNDYAALMQREKGQAFYAMRVISSTPEARDGLYWPTEEGEQPSPMGDLMAQASVEGYKVGDGQERVPYHGYYYKILTEQGPDASGGAIDYVAHDKMIGGFGLIAWPAEYGNSGIMTFTVNYSGVLYQKDLGEDTEKLASEVRAFNPDPTWEKVKSEDEDEGEPAKDE